MRAKTKKRIRIKLFIYVCLLFFAPHVSVTSVIIFRVSRSMNTRSAIDIT
jgi:hypothetical protein